MSDKKFREWVSRQPSCLDGKFSEFTNGEWRNLACHVRRASNAGTAYKPEFSCVPMTNAQHQYQHSHGELACILAFATLEVIGDSHGMDSVETAKEWFDLQAKKYREMWEKL